VLAWCRNEVLKQDALQLNVVRALRKEAELAGVEDEAAHVASRVGQLNNLARPWIPEVAGAAEIHFWGMHPDATQELGGAQRGELFGAQLLDDPAFSPYQVVRYRAHYGLKVEDFPKFSSGDPSTSQPAGGYFRAYDERIARLNSTGNTVTPHLDKRWHLPAFMPDLNPRKVQEDEARIDRAWLLGLIHGFLRVVERDLEPVWEFSREGKLSPVVTRGAPTPGRLHALHDALHHNPSIVGHVLEKAQAEHEQDRARHPGQIEEHRFVKGCAATPAFGRPANILDLVCRYGEGVAPSPELEREQEETLGLLLGEIEAYFVRVHGPQQARTAREAAAAFIERLAAESPTYAGADRDGYHFQHWSSIVQAKLDALRAR
jgi:hypothetical protein